MSDAPFLLAIRDEAFEDIQLARKWYESQRKGLGRDFAIRVDQAMSRIEERLETFGLVMENV